MGRSTFQLPWWCKRISVWRVWHRLRLREAAASVTDACWECERLCVCMRVCVGEQDCGQNLNSICEPTTWCRHLSTHACVHARPYKRMLLSLWQLNSKTHKRNPGAISFEEQQSPAAQHESKVASDGWDHLKDGCHKEDLHTHSWSKSFALAQLGRN